MRKMAIGIVPFLLLGFFIAPTAAHADEPCADYVFVGARGTGAPPQGTDPYDLDQYKGMGPEAWDLYVALKSKVVAVGATITPVGLRFPAVGDPGSIFKKTAQYSSAYDGSIRTGGADLKSKAQFVTSYCSHSKLILFGYSQGADAIGMGIDLLNAEEKSVIAATVLFGDPGFNSSDRAANRGTYEPHHSGIWDYRPHWDSKLDTPVYSYCRYGDIACNISTLVSGTDLSARDFAFVQGWANKKHGGDTIAEHAQYHAKNDGKRAANAVAKVLGLDCEVDPAVTPRAFLAGPTTVRVGELASFSGAGSEVGDCDTVNWRWDVSAEVAGGDASRSPAGENESEDPESVEPFLDKTFVESGMYTVNLTVQTEGGDLHAQSYLNVLPAETSKPSMPIFNRSDTVDGDLLLSWDSSGPVPGDLYVIADPAGNTYDSVIPIRETGLDGVDNFEYVVRDLAASDPRNFTVIAVNQVGSTTGRLRLPAAGAQYEHQVWDGSASSGGVFELSGTVTPNLASTLGYVDGEMSAPLAGNYDADLIGDDRRLEIDMSDSDATIELVDGQWTLGLDIADATDSDGVPISRQLRGGFATSFLNSGLVAVRIGGENFAVTLDGNTFASETNQFVINTDANVPSGVEIDEYDGSTPQAFVELRHNGVYDQANLPVYGELAHPESFEWQSADISDVRVYAGGQELDFVGEVDVYQVLNPDSTSDASISLGLYGQVGDASYLTLRSFVEDGAVSFRVNGGERNVVSLNASPQVSETLFPEPAEPIFSGPTDLVAYPDQWFNWSPTVDWGVDGWGNISISAVELPAGLSANWDSISGVPTQGGTATFVVSATNSMGTTEQVYSMTVYSSDVETSEAEYVHRTVSGGQVSGGTLTMSGAETSYLEDLAQTGSLSLDDGAQATLAPSQGAPITWTLRTADAEFETAGDHWAVTFELGETLDSAGASISQSMRNGYADALFAGGSVTIQIDGHPVKLLISAATDTSQVNKWVIDPEAVVPDGVVTSHYYGNEEVSTIEFVHDGEYDADFFPAYAETANAGSYDWGSAAISDVHFYIGDDEVISTANVVLWFLDGSDSTEDGSISASITGPVGDGTYLTHRAFLEDGTVSFSVNGGSTNVLKWNASSPIAADVFPIPTTPTVTDASQFGVTQFEDFYWTPSVTWGGAAQGSYSLAAAGTLPEGVHIWKNTETGKDEVYGWARYETSFDIVVRATNYMGTTSKTITFDAGPSIAKPFLDLSTGSVWRNSNGTLLFSFINIHEHIYVDNKTISTFFPAVGESGLGLGEPDFHAFQASDVHLYADGVEVPITGTFNVSFNTTSYLNQTVFSVGSENLTIGDNSTATIESVVRRQLTLTLRRGDGAVNTFYKPRWGNWWVLAPRPANF